MAKQVKSCAISDLRYVYVVNFAGASHTVSLFVVLVNVSWISHTPIRVGICMPWERQRTFLQWFFIAVVLTKALTAGAGGHQWLRPVNTKIRLKSATLGFSYFRTSTRTVGNMLVRHLGYLKWHIFVDKSCRPATSCSARLIVLKLLTAPASNRPIIPERPSESFRNP